MKFELAGVYIGPGPRDSCPLVEPFILIMETLDWLHVSKGKIVTFVNSASTVNLALEGTTCQKLWQISMV
jgi:hypothetical protein